VDGLLFGNSGQFVTQLLAILIAIAYSGILSFVLLKIIQLFTPLKASDKEEGMGLDVTQHGEEAYTDGDGAILIAKTDSTKSVLVGQPAGSKA
jgi:Amt family ammonium transporter